MNDIGMTKGPLFANALHCGSGESLGRYYFIPDLILIPSGNWGVRSHEVGHRVFTYDGTSGSDWLVVRRLVGISHALCKNIYGLVTGHGLYIHGKRLGELRVSGQDPVRTTVEELLSEVEEYEHVIDEVWRNLVPVAEMAAIDFSEVLYPSLYGFQRPSLSTQEREKVDEQKARSVQAAVAGYPPGFGEHHRIFGSFQEAVRQAWKAYNKIEDDIARKELLRLAMSSFIPVDNKICILDPIKLVLDDSAFAEHDAEGARKAFSMERLNRSRAIFAWFEHYIESVEQCFKDDIRKAWFTIDLIQDVRAEWEKEGYDPGPNVGMYDLLDFGKWAWFSFLKFEWSESGGGIAKINFAMFDRICKRVPSDPSFPIRWLFSLLFREAFRWTLKTGQPIVCPFKSYKISPPQSKEALKCSANCLMRQWLTQVSRWSNLVSDDALCEIPTAKHHA